MHINVQSRWSNVLARPVAAAVLYMGKNRPVAVASFPAHLNAYKVPSLREAARLVRA